MHKKMHHHITICCLAAIPAHAHRALQQQGTKPALRCTASCQKEPEGSSQWHGGACTYHTQASAPTQAAQLHPAFNSSTHPTVLQTMIPNTQHTSPNQGRSKARCNKQTPLLPRAKLHEAVCRLSTDACLYQTSGVLWMLCMQIHFPPPQLGWVPLLHTSTQEEGHTGPERCHNQGSFPLVLFWLLRPRIKHLSGTSRTVILDSRNHMHHQPSLPWCPFPTPCQGILPRHTPSRRLCAFPHVFSSKP
jgi:hypothetical protein